MRAVFGQCRTPKTAPREKHSRTAARGTPGGACLACLLPLLSVHNISLCAGIACRGLHHRPPGVLFWYGLTMGNSQIGLAHPLNLLFSKSNISAHGYCYSSQTLLFLQQISRCVQSHSSLVVRFLITDVRSQIGFKLVAS